MAEAERSLVLWDIDRTLLYVGEIDRQVYREAFAEIVGRPAERLPARGTGVTMPLAIRSLLLHNGVPASDVPYCCRAWLNSCRSVSPRVRKTCASRASSCQVPWRP